MPLAAIPSVGAHSSGADLKACEDIIDAIVCAWVATTALDGKAIPYGDADAAIWIPEQELLWLGGCVEELGRVVHSICSEWIADPGAKALTAT